MDNFCRYCGRKLENGEVCGCTQSQQAAGAQQQQAQQGTAYQPDNGGQGGYVPYQNQGTPYKQAPVIKNTYNIEAFSFLSLIFGVIAVVCGSGGWAQLALGIIAIVLWHLSKSRRNPGDILNERFALAGLVLGCIALVIFLIVIISAAVAVTSIYSGLNSLF